MSLVSNDSTHSHHFQDLIDIDLSILSKKAVQATPTDQLPDYFTRDENNRLVSTNTGFRAFRGIGSAHTIDSHNEIVDIEAIKKVMDTMMKMGGVMLYNHTNLVAGKMLGWGEATVFDEKLGKEFQAVYVDFEVFDYYEFHDELLKRMDLPSDHPESINMLTIGGKKLKKVRECNTERCWTRVTEIEGHEWSVTEKGANPYAFILEKTRNQQMQLEDMLTKYYGDKMSNQQVTQENLRDQTEMTLNIPDEEHTHNGDCGCNGTPNQSNLNKKDDDDEKDKDMDKEDEEDEDEDMDKEEDEDEDEDDMKKFLVNQFSEIFTRLDALEKGDTQDKKPKVPKTIKHEGQTYILQKSADSEVKELRSEIDKLKKSSPVEPTTAELTQSQINSAEPQGALEKEVDAIKKMSIAERADYVGRNNRERLANMGVHLQN